MKFTLEVRMINEHELRSTNPFLPEYDDYEMYLATLQEDLSKIETISAINRNASTLELQTKCSVLLADLRELIKPLFTPDIMRSIRFVSLHEHGVISPER